MSEPTEGVIRVRFEPRTALDDLMDLIEESGLRVVFWVCPKGCNGFVDWADTNDGDGKKSTPTCRECGEKGAAR